EPRSGARDPRRRRRRHDPRSRVRRTRRRLPAPCVHGGAGYPHRSPRPCGRVPATPEYRMTESYDPTAETDDPSDWEERFEAQLNTFFDEAIARIPGFVDRNLTSFKRVMSRAVSPKTGIADILIGVRN